MCLWFHSYSHAAHPHHKTSCSHSFRKKKKLLDMMNYRPSAERDLPTSCPTWLLTVPFHPQHPFPPPSQPWEPLGMPDCKAQHDDFRSETLLSQLCWQSVEWLWEKVCPLNMSKRWSIGQWLQRIPVGNTDPLGKSHPFVRCPSSHISLSPNSSFLTEHLLRLCTDALENVSGSWQQGFPWKPVSTLRGLSDLAVNWGSWGQPPAC